MSHTVWYVVLGLVAVAAPLAIGAFLSAGSYDPQEDPVDLLPRTEQEDAA